MAKAPLHPGLYDPEAEQPALNGTTCKVCGSVFFPAITLGCEKCGATPDQLQATSLATSGSLHSVATVHIHMGKDIEAPFTVAEVKLDGGPLIRALMMGPASAEDIGKRVTGQWFIESSSDDNPDKIEPRFSIVEEEAA
ncbi:MAG: hypothetical protein Hens2KO_10350 [Henriciella sp.]